MKKKRIIIKQTKKLKMTFLWVMNTSFWNMKTKSCYPEPNVCKIQMAVP